MKTKGNLSIPIGTQALIMSKRYYSVLSKRLEGLDTERYFSILYFLYEHNGCNQQCICNNLAIDKTAMVKVIDYLIKLGIVDRNVNPKDRREHFIVLTKKGVKQTEEIVKRFQEIDEEIFTNISSDEKETFLKTLNQLSSNLREMPSTDLFFNYKKTGRKRKKHTSTDKV